MDHSVDVENAELLPRGGYEKVLRQIIADGHCPFCGDNLQRVHPEPILWKNAHWIVTTNAWPYMGASIHFLLISTEHIEQIEDLSPEARLAFFEAYDRLSQTYGFPGASILWRSGETSQTGASVRHLHAQVIVGHPRTKNAKPITGLLGFGPPK